MQITVQDTSYPSALSAGFESTGRHLLRISGHPAVILLLITIGLFWKITLTGQYTWMDHPDMVSQVLPIAAIFCFSPSLAVVIPAAVLARLVGGAMLGVAAIRSLGIGHLRMPQRHLDRPDIGAALDEV